MGDDYLRYRVADFYIDENGHKFDFSSQLLTHHPTRSPSSEGLVRLRRSATEPSFSARHSGRPTTARGAGSGMQIDPGMQDQLVEKHTVHGSASKGLEVISESILEVDSNAHDPPKSGIQPKQRCGSAESLSATWGSGSSLSGSIQDSANQSWVIMAH